MTDLNQRVEETNLQKLRSWVFHCFGMLMFSTCKAALRKEELGPAPVMQQLLLAERILQNEEVLRLGDGLGERKEVSAEVSSCRSRHQGNCRGGHHPNCKDELLRRKDHLFSSPEVGGSG